MAGQPSQHHNRHHRSSRLRRRRPVTMARSSHQPWRGLTGESNSSSTRCGRVRKGGGDGREKKAKVGAPVEGANKGKEKGGEVRRGRRGGGRFMYRHYSRATAAGAYSGARQTQNSVGADPPRQVSVPACLVLLLRMRMRMRCLSLRLTTLLLIVIGFQPFFPISHLPTCPLSILLCARWHVFRPLDAHRSTLRRLLLCGRGSRRSIRSPSPCYSPRPRPRPLSGRACACISHGLPPSGATTCGDPYGRVRAPSTAAARGAGVHSPAHDRVCLPVSNQRMCAYRFSKRPAHIRHWPGHARRDVPQRGHPAPSSNDD